MSTEQPTLTPAYLRTLPAVRQRSQLVYTLAQQDQLEFFTLHEEKLDEVVDYCIDVIKKDYGEDYASIPPHSRWRHFVTPQKGDQLGPVVEKWQDEGVEKDEVAKRLIDLFVVSVLLDAGAGYTWKYYSASAQEYAARSEGLALASLDMFLDGTFHSADFNALRVDSKALRNLTVDDVGKGLQHGKVGFVTGLKGRAELLIRLGQALEARPDIFKGEDGVYRPGNMVDYLLPSTSTTSDVKSIEVEAMWEVVMDGLGPIWPEARTQLEGVSLGDAWVCTKLKNQEDGSAAGIVPFHKLSQWLTYSLMEPLQKVLGCKVNGVEQMTGLPEYRNGGLLIDLGFLEIKYSKFGGWGVGRQPDDSPCPSPSDNWVPRVTVDSQTVVEWRAITVIALDKIAQAIKDKLGAPDLTTAQILEAATWKAGRLVAKESRPAGGPPIDIISDGTVF